MILGFDLCSVRGGDRFDGHSAVVLNLASALERVAHECPVHLELYAPAGSVIPALGTNHLRAIRPWPLCSSPDRLVRYCLCTRLLVKAPSVFLNIASSPQLRFARCVRVSIVHDIAFMIDKWRSYYTEDLRRYLQENTEAALRKAHGVIAVSNQTRDDLIRHFDLNPARVRVVYNGFDEALFNTRAVSADQLVIEKLGGGPYILSVGTIQPRKNYPLLIRSFSRLRRESDLPHRLVIVGAPGWLSEESITLAKQHAGDGVILWGRAAVTEVPALMRHASAFVFPALYEGFGIPLVEAMACGAPVVASNTGPVPEVLGGAGLLFDPLSEDGLLDALRNILTDSDLASRLRSRSLERAGAFSWDKAARECIDFAGRIAAMKDVPLKSRLTRHT